MEKTRLALICTYDSLCGLALFLRHYIRALPKGRFNIKVFCEKDLPNVPRLTTIPNIPYVKCWSRLETFRQLFETIKKYKPDIVHMIHEPAMFGVDERLPPLFNNLKTNGIKTVLHLQAPLPQLIPYYTSLDLDYYIVNNYPREEILLPMYGLPKERLKYIPIGVLPIKKISKKKARKQLKIYPGTNVFITTGFVRAATGPNELIEAVAPAVMRYPHTELVFAGGIHPFDSDMYIRRGEQYALFKGIKNNIVFTKKFHSEKELSTILSASDIYLQYRSHYGLPVASGSLMRAYSVGIPIIAYDYVGLEALTKGIIKVQSIGEMTSSILQLLEDKKLYRRLKKESKELGKEWAMKNVIKEYVKIYDKILEE